MTENAVFITAARRTPLGSFNGSLSHLAAQELGAVAITAVVNSAACDPDQVDEVIMGQVLTAGGGMNPARQAARLAGLPDSVTAFGVNQVCGSGLRAVALGMQQILCGDAQIIVAGGQESMSRAPHLAHMRAGKKLGHASFTDSVLHDGLTDAFYGYPMGMTAENIAHRFQLDRAAQDDYALKSQSKASGASRSGAFNEELVTITLREGTAADRAVSDEFIRHDASAQGMAKLKPAFKADGTVTAANSSGINDGAAAVLLMSARALQHSGATELARIVSWATAGLDPAVMGLGPVPATTLALKKAGWSTDDVDLWEINEAFAAQALAVIGELHVDTDKVNVNGGAIALGHPIGASGARILVSLLHAMKARRLKRGVATLCIGGGMGIALCVEC